MNAAPERNHQNVSFPEHNGLRLKNYRNDCYLNAAVNNIITNNIIMEEIRNPYPLGQWKTQQLMEHQPNYNLTNIPVSEQEINDKWQHFISSTLGCTQQHGETALVQLKNNIFARTPSSV